MLNMRKASQRLEVIQRRDVNGDQPTSRAQAVCTTAVGRPATRPPASGAALPLADRIVLAMGGCSLR
ncbi:hypothetical protein RR46_09285 [Papilio xuthus]|uniref:Uncharacterized protein n=1 Tax=Papilio xuthus TaxID=66420 RepID=A0A194PWJ1_PAPXU|nr:hypothetical protein RR46_09285 [Papilio xuthus]